MRRGYTGFFQNDAIWSYEIFPERRDEVVRGFPERCDVVIGDSPERCDEVIIRLAL